MICNLNITILTFTIASMINTIPDELYIDFLIFAFMSWVTAINDQTSNASFREYFESKSQKWLLEQQFLKNYNDDPMDIWFDPEQMKMLH